MTRWNDIAEPKREERRTTHIEASAEMSNGRDRMPRDP